MTERPFIDKSEFEQWLDNMQEVTTEEFERFLYKFLTDMVSVLLANTQMRTPVKTGDLRRAWHVGKTVVKGTTIGVEIINDAYHDDEENYPGNTGYYASFIEYGFTGKGGPYKGRFMLTISMNELKAAMPKAYDNAFNAWVRRMDI